MFNKALLTLLLNVELTECRNWLNGSEMYHCIKDYINDKVMVTSRIIAVILGKS